MSNFVLARLFVALMAITSVTSISLPFGRRHGTNYVSSQQAVGHHNSLSTTDKVTTVLNTPEIDADKQQHQAHPSPSGGSLYTISVPVPVIGRHDASVLFFEDNSCHLKVTGSVKVDERVAFDMNPNGSFKYSLSEKTMSILARFLVRVKETGYDAKKDETYMIASIASVLRFRVRMKRSMREVMA